MLPFEGFLDSVVQQGNSIVARFIVGGFDPTPQLPPVLLVEIENPNESEAVFSALCGLQQSEEGTYVDRISEAEVLVQTDHEAEIRITGRQITFTQCQFEGSDFERLAKANHDWGKTMLMALNESQSRVQEVRSLLHQQHSRVLIKLQRHEHGTTAHTLYQQQLSLLSRLLEVAGA